MVTSYLRTCGGSYTVVTKSLGFRSSAVPSLTLKPIGTSTQRSLSAGSSPTLTALLLLDVNRFHFQKNSLCFLIIKNK